MIRPTTGREEAMNTKTSIQSLRKYHALAVAHMQAAMAARDFPLEQMWREQAEWFKCELNRALQGATS